MKALEEWYAKQEEIVMSGPTPLPLLEQDYKRISQERLRYLGSSDVYGLALDGSPRAQAVFNKLIQSYDVLLDNADRGVIGILPNAEASNQR